MEVINSLIEVGKKLGILNPFPPHKSDFGETNLRERIAKQGPLPTDGLGEDLSNALDRRVTRKITFSSKADEEAYKLGEAAMTRRVRSEQSLDTELDE